MSVLVQLEARARPESVTEMSDALAKLLPQTRAYDGCIDIHAYLNEDGQTFVFVGHWASKAHYERYFAWREETGVLAQLLSYLAEPPGIRYFDRLSL